MNIIRLKLIVTVLFLGALLVLALPEFTIRVGDRDFTYPSVGFGKIGIGADYGSFQRGKDLYPTYKYLVKVNFNEGTEEEDKDDIFAETLERIENRIEYASLYDLELQGEVKNDEYFLAFYIPEYYPEHDDYIKTLTLRGTIGFDYLLDPLDESTRVDVTITDKNIKRVETHTNLKYRYNANNQSQDQVASGLHISLEIAEPKVADARRFPGFEDYINQFGSRGVYGATMSIDGTPAFQIIRDDYKDGFLRAFPIDYEIVKTRSDLLKVIVSLFQESTPIEEVSFETQTGTTLIAPKYNPEGTTFIAVMFIAGIVLTFMAFIKNIGVKRTVIAGLMLSFTWLLAINFFKLILEPLSIGVVIGSLVFTLINLLVILRLVALNTEEEIDAKITIMKYISIVLAASFVIAYFSDLNIGMYIPFIEVGVVFFIMLTVSLFFNYKFLLNTFISKNITLGNIFGFRK